MLPNCAYFPRQQGPVNPLKEVPLHLAIGVFDGVHVGHQTVLRHAVEAARLVQGKAGLLTFDPHPSRIVRPEQATRLLFPLADRIEATLQFGVDFVIVQPFSQAIAALSPTAFLEYLHEGLPTLKGVHIGENFRFGRDRCGDPEQLRADASRYGIAVHSLPRREDSAEAVSSSRIRRALGEGRLAEVTRCLGRPFMIKGKVVPGKQLGRTLGFPTLNIPWPAEAHPLYGVYRVEVRLGDSPESSWLPAIANFGLRPTVENASVPLLEAHVLRWPYPAAADGSAGKAIAVRLLDFIRPEMKFPSREALIGQIQNDVRREQAYLQAASAKQTRG